MFFLCHLRKTSFSVLLLNWIKKLLAENVSHFPWKAYKIMWKTSLSTGNSKKVTSALFLPFPHIIRQIIAFFSVTSLRKKLFKYKSQFEDESSTFTCICMSWGRYFLSGCAWSTCRKTIENNALGTWRELHNHRKILSPRHVYNYNGKQSNV